MSHMTFHAAAIFIVTLFLASPGRGQTSPDLPEPTVGQAGKDVVWVPSPPELVEKMLDLAGVTNKDLVVDLGSGDGRIVIAAAKRGAKAMGVEYDERLIAASHRNAKTAGVEGKVTFVKEDMYVADFSKADVLALFLLPSNLQTLTNKFLAMPPGTRIVVNTFEIPNWSPDKTESIDACDPWCTAHLWIVPAKVDGKWRMGDGDVQFQQSFQIVGGTVTDNGVQTPVSGRLLGDQLKFTVGTAEYAGRVAGDTVEGTKTVNGQQTRFKATRVR